VVLYETLKFDSDFTCFSNAVQDVVRGGRPSPLRYTKHLELEYDMHFEQYTMHASLSPVIFHATNLRSLEIDHDFVLPALMLARHACATQLRALWVRNPSFNHGLAGAMSSISFFVVLRTLDLHLDHTRQDVSWIANIKPWCIPTLENLEIYSDSVYTLGVAHLLSQCTFASLRALHLCMWDLTLHGATLIARFCSALSLQTMRLGYLEGDLHATLIPHLHTNILSMDDLRGPIVEYLSNTVTELHVAKPWDNEGPWGFIWAAFDDLISGRTTTVRQIRLRGYHFDSHRQWPGFEWQFVQDLARYDGLLLQKGISFKDEAGKTHAGYVD
jgi:hypothetical protein